MALQPVTPAELAALQLRLYRGDHQVDLLPLTEKRGNLNGPVAAVDASLRLPEGTCML